MRVERELPFLGTIVWLTEEQGGRASGPPPTPSDHDYAATAFVPPATLKSGVASFVLRVTDRAAWRSEAKADWLIVPDDGDHRIGPGTLVVVTEGPRVVAYFHVREVV